MDLDARTCRALVLGGGLLGAGGGGSWKEGLELLEAALRIGRPRLVDLAELAPDTTLVTVSGVGAPAATDDDVRIADYLRAVESLGRRSGREIGGLISSENGGFSSANGFVQSALLGIPVVDAPGNGRAHPTGVMGSMGLHRRRGYLSQQAAVGGTPGRHRVDLYIEGDLASVDGVVRRAAVAAGGLVAVARNPVEASYVREHGAPGALALAVRVGEIIGEHAPHGGAVVAERVLELFGDGDVVGRGPVARHRLRTEGGYDLGDLEIAGLEVTFWNEFMTVDRGGERLATFPDLIFALDAESGLPVGTAELADGHEVVLATVPAARLPLGAGVKDPVLLAQIETVLRVPIPTEAPC